MRPTVRFSIAFALTILYLAFAVVISADWRNDVRESLGPVAAWVLPTLLAYAPGFLIGFLFSTILISRYHAPSLEPPAGPWNDGEWPPLTILIAALDEELSITQTVLHIGASEYPGDLELILVDNGSTDRTVELAESAAQESGVKFRCIDEPEPGKFRALNAGLADVSSPLVVTVDADTYVHSDAFSQLVARTCQTPQDQHVSACAGALIVENWNQSLITRMQSWDYRLGINGVKLMQASYHCTLVAQGALSAYWTDDLKEVGGWPDAITEDIIVTWSLLAK